MKEHQTKKSLEEIFKETKVEKVDTVDNLKKSFMSYAMAVNVSRAIPDVRDGLKPVHRRILFAMGEMNNFYDKQTKKCARIVGDVMGKYHPHGDSSIYDALVRFAQDFSMRYPLVDGQGNFGSVDGDPPAAMRYTEARLAKIAGLMLQDIDKETVDFMPNFDNQNEEPKVLPAKIPNLLVNGADGIAVGMTTNIPTHNLGEVVDAVCACMDHEDITTQELMEYIHGPDFPTGGIVINKSELLDIYEHGTGKIKIRGKVEFEQAARRTDKDKLVITEIPYTMIGVNIGKFISDIVNLIESKKITDVVDVSN